jgi:general secretion pathway protein G
MLSRLRAPRGFTLLEVMVVIVILGILAALVVPNIIGRPDEARVIAAKQDIASLMQALKLYRLDNQRYPTTEQGLQSLVTKPATAPVPPNWKAGGYIERLPKDPWGNASQFLNPGVRGEIDVFSFAGDGARRRQDATSALEPVAAQHGVRSGAHAHQILVVLMIMGLFVAW